MSEKRLLVTGATGKVGQAFLRRFLSDARFTDWIARGFVHSRPLPPADRLESVKGSMDQPDDIARAMDKVTHVLHLATVKETPDAIMDVAVKGLFYLLEACRTSPQFEQFLLIGGDAGIGHFFYPRAVPVTEQQPHSAYPGCYALSKVLEEVMLEQYYIQYDFNGCCLRAPWIMEKDDFKYTLSWGEDVFGGPRWRDLVPEEEADAYARAQTVPVMLGADKIPVLRNFVHVDDLSDAICAALDHPKAHQQTFNICMNEPVDYRFVGDYLARTRGLPTVDVPTPYHSTWLDNDKGKFLVCWRPNYDTARLIDASWDYMRAADDPRIIWYPG